MRLQAEERVDVVDIIGNAEDPGKVKRGLGRRQSGVAAVELGRATGVDISVGVGFLGKDAVFPRRGGDQRRQGLGGDAERPPMLAAPAL